LHLFEHKVSCHGVGISGSMLGRGVQRRRLRPSIAAAALVCVVFLVAASGGRAATVTVTIGSDLSAAPEEAQNCGPCTEGLTALPNAQITAPCTGTITGWHVRGYMGTAPANVELRVLHPNGSGQYSGAGTSGPDHTRHHRRGPPGEHQSADHCERFHRARCT
jgi:hypothetical protein